MHVKGGGTFASYKKLGLSFNPPIHVRRMRSLSGIRWRAIIGTAMETVVKDYRAIQRWYNNNKTLLKGLSFLFSHGGIFWLHASNKLISAAGRLSKCLQNRDGQIYTVGIQFKKFLEALQKFQLDDYMPHTLSMHGDGTLSILATDGHDEIKMPSEIGDTNSYSTARTDFLNYVKEVQKKL